MENSISGGDSWRRERQFRLLNGINFFFRSLRTWMEATSRDGWGKSLKSLRFTTSKVSTELFIYQTVNNFSESEKSWNSQLMTSRKQLMKRLFNLASNCTQPSLLVFCFFSLKHIRVTWNIQKWIEPKCHRLVVPFILVSQFLSEAERKENQTRIVIKFRVVDKMENCYLLSSSSSLCAPKKCFCSEYAFRLSLPHFFSFFFLLF